MSEFHQSNRTLSENYRSELQTCIDDLICLGDFPAPETTNPQKFYLEFKNQIVPLVNTETQRRKDDLAHTDNSHLILLNNTALVDTVLQAAFRAAVWLYNHSHQKQLQPQDVPVAVIARGGYGREEIYFRSDVDVQIVSKSDLTDEEAEGAEQIVKHLEYLFIHQDIFQTSASSCYTEIDTLGKNLATGKLADFFSLLENRLVAGNSIVYAEFKSTLKTAALLHKENLLNHCYQHKSYYDVSNTVFQQEPNVKEELRRLYWALALVRLKRGLEQANHFELLDELFDLGILSAPAFKNMQAAFAFMSKVRLILHCHQKGAHRDVMSYEVREDIAHAMGYEVKEFFREYFYQAAYPLKRYSRNLFLESTIPDTQKVKNLSRHFAVNSENQIILDKEPEVLFSEHPESVFKIFAWVAEKDYFLSYPIVRAVERHIDQMCPLFIDREDQREVLSYFKRVINGKYFAKALRLLHEFGLLGNFYLPEFKSICGLLQDVYVHHFPTDMHVLSALDVLNGIEIDKETDPFLSDLYHSLRDKTTLKLAVLLHDIGKGVRAEGQNEELLGARMVPGILENLGYSKDNRRANDVVFLVEKHLMMHDLLFLDPEEDDTYDMIWDLVDHDIERLKMLILLTYADRGGTKMKMSSSQVELLKMFYQYTLHHKKRQDVPQSIKADFLKMVRLPREMQAHLEIYNEFCQSREHFAAGLLFNPTQASELVICTNDRPGLLYCFSAILAFNRLNIVEAKIHTLRGHVFDIFKVASSTGAPIDYADSFFLQKQVREDLRRAAVDQEPLSKIFEGRSLPVSSEENKIKDVKLKVKIIGRAVKVDSHDLLGTFMVLTKVFSQFDVEIQKAVLHTSHGTASNIFYLRPKDVREIIENESRFIRTLEKALRQLIEAKEMLLDEPKITAPLKQTLAS
ncbi:MAG: HD domain-containing protein [Nitrospinae bacterium]|nr:HD domain-containing protein [Nitrospinota bacterium]